MYSEATAATIATEPEQVPTKCGNIWMMAATVVLALASERDVVNVLTIDGEGAIEAVGPHHPDFERRMLSQDFVSAVDANTDVTRLASRIRVAALRRASAS